MAKILITYDLNTPGRDYPRISERIKALGGGNWCHPVESVWIILTNLTSVQVRDDLWNYVDASSKLLVVDITDDPMAWQGLAQDVSNWLSAN